MTTTFIGSKYHAEEEDEEEDDEDEDEEEDSCSSTSFSLQECINEFRARRIRRVSTHSRDCENVHTPGPMVVPDPQIAASADADLINQNRCNKAQERKGKPCKNGFCYCFTSDSGDCGSIIVPTRTRDSHVRHQKRSRRLESHHNQKLSTQLPKDRSKKGENQQGCRSNPAALAPLTAVSRLCTTDENAPLIHIIQELRDNCVVSEVRVNRHKLSETSRRSKSQPVMTPKVGIIQPRIYEPTAPPLSNISEQNDSAPIEEDHHLIEEVGTSLKSGRSRRSSSGGGGRLLQKRLSSQGEVSFKTRDALKPPPKPPRRVTQSLDGKFSLSSLTSTCASVREAEQVLDEFLKSRGIQLPKSSSPTKKTKRKSYPMSATEKPKCKPNAVVPSCPSLSDMERIVKSKRGVHYAKNIQQALSRKEPVEKNIIIGWAEPKIEQMLNHQSKVHQSQAEPQVAIGWQLPSQPQIQQIEPRAVMPKVSLDTVDGGVCENLDRGKKHTPIKYPTKGEQASQKFIWGEQWRNLSPWNGSKKGKSLGKKSKNFLNQSKQKILRFVSPKKTNHQQEDHSQTLPRHCSVGVQTSMQSRSNLELNLQSLSPPGSYHSPVQSTPSASSGRQQNVTDLEPERPYFDFERQVPAPRISPKKLSRCNRARKLDFKSTEQPTRTYRSYQKELDQDVTITKIGYLLSSIREKLEASDDRAVQTFQDCTRFNPLKRHENVTFDCLDGPHRSVISTSDEGALQTHQHVEQLHNSEPIYSEIEEDCLRIRGSPQYEVRTAAFLPEITPVSTPCVGVSTLAVNERKATTVPVPPPIDPDVIYAKVKKPCKMQVKTQPVALGKFLHESLKNGSFFQFSPLPMEPSSSFDVLTEATESRRTPSTVHQSLNNISEQHSPPKKNRSLSKSELSLQRSEIFLDNLCRSEIVLDREESTRLEKVPNNCLRQIDKSTSADVVSYDLPHESGAGLYEEFEMVDASAGGTSFATTTVYGSCQIEPLSPPSENQSTPKKKPDSRFTTKPTRSLSVDINDGPSTPVRPFGLNLSQSCPTSPHQPPSASLDEFIDTLPSRTESQLLSVSAMARYRLLKDAVRRSYRRGKSLILAKTHSLNQSHDQSNQTEGELDGSTTYASFQLDSLLNNSLSTNEQLAAAVSICRQMPDLEISAEMVEAERLLLFSTLRQKSLTDATRSQIQSQDGRKAQCFLIDGMQLPVRADASQDMFFNYYFISTFECEGRICSTQSVECQSGMAVFRDCGLEFYSSDQADTLELRCQIFMLRLRKVSTLALEPTKTMKQRDSTSLSSSSSCSTSREQIVSRFRLHASFSLRPSQLAPFDLVASETKSSDEMCLRSFRSWSLPLTSHTKSTNLEPYITLTGRVEVRLPKVQYAAYLNVQDSKTKHHWNRHWCTLEGVQLSVWRQENNLSDEPPLINLQLDTNRRSTVDPVPRELCARARTFMLNCRISNGESMEVFFAADTQAELTDWLKHLNETLAFSKKWLSGGEA
ncbi:uncharacterized protein Dwil_GK23171 [Drosophila willistoni]|uniref:PH domain-containing protein n=1 Tax=Drosophila willistoni TaxID=7260 RepID=B4NML4_DROWI|nr:uncharacterized protein LOC6652434 [Drosophila willistoni]EDW85603.1 uncharacterized protein Dwil_GK23171 [Drosophila willistoni]